MTIVGDMAADVLDGADLDADCCGLLLNRKLAMSNGDLCSPAASEGVWNDPGVADGLLLLVTGVGGGGMQLHEAASRAQLAQS